MKVDIIVHSFDVINVNKFAKFVDLFKREFGISEHKEL